MEDFRQQFLLESVETLADLSNDLQNAEMISDSRKRDAFRLLHTVKGTAQTFNFKTASRLAHELETLLSKLTEKNYEAEKSLFLEGIDLLIESLHDENFQIPVSFTEKIRVIIPDSTTSTKDVSDDFALKIPSEFLSQLSVQEKNTLRSAMRNGKNLFCLEVGFELKNFADELINFREMLNETGEIIATLPSDNFSRDGRISFQILLASVAESSEIVTVAEENAAEIIFDSSAKKFTSNIAASVLSLVVEHGKDLASKSGKQIEFETFADETEISPAQLKIIFDALLHLIRNAVDHAVESAGKIKINLTKKANSFLLIVSDDGDGIDLKKLKDKAIQKNIIADNDNLSERELIDLIFQPEFSTKSVVTETSGRGIGLDAVKSSIENAGGTINAKSETGKGATFEIFLPQ